MQHHVHENRFLEICSIILYNTSPAQKLKIFIYKPLPLIKNMLSAINDEKFPILLNANKSNSLDVIQYVFDSPIWCKRSQLT